MKWITTGQPLPLRTQPRILQYALLIHPVNGVSKCCLLVPVINVKKPTYKSTKETTLAHYVWERDFIERKTGNKTKKIIVATKMKLKLGSIALKTKY